MIGKCICAALAIAALGVAQAQSGSIGSGNGIGGTNVDNIAFSTAGNVIILELALEGGTSLELAGPSVDALLQQLEASGGAASGPLALAIKTAAKEARQP